MKCSRCDLELKFEKDRIYSDGTVTRSALCKCGILQVLVQQPVKFDYIKITLKI
jgi:hypothetical protein